MATVLFVSGGIDTKPRIGGGGAGDGVFLMWLFGKWCQPVLPGGHCFSVFATRMVGRFPRRPVSGSMAWRVSGSAVPSRDTWTDPGGRVSLPD